MRHARHLFFISLLLAAESIEADLNLKFRVGRQPELEPVVTCGTALVGFRFRGQPGQVFEYAGERYEIDAERYVELIAHRRRMTYTINGVQVVLRPAPADPFGFVDVQLPAPLPPPLPASPARIPPAQ